MTVAIGRGACSSPFDGRRGINRRKNASWLELAYQMTEQSHRQPPVSRWFSHAHRSKASQDFPLGYRIAMGPHIGELVSTYANFTERYYRFRFDGETSQRIISQTRLHELVSKLVDLSPKLLPAGRIRGNYKKVDTPDVIYLAPTKKAAS